jgi:hypothetical protein
MIRINLIVDGQPIPALKNDRPQAALIKIHTGKNAVSLMLASLRAAKTGLFCRAGWQPAADWQIGLSKFPTIFPVDSLSLRPEQAD